MANLDKETLDIIQLFNSPLGKEVLEKLRKRFKENDGIPQTVDGVYAAILMAEERGAASVINYIERQIAKGAANE